MTTVAFAKVPPGVEEKSITVNGITTSYWEIGEGDPLVMTHGGGPGAAGIINWYTTMPLFAERGFRAIAVNMLGYGLANYPEPGNSSYPEPGFRYDVDARRRHLLAQLDELGIEKADLMGNSMGGTSSLGVCAIAPHRVRRLVLMGSGGLPTPPGDKLMTAATRYEPSLASMTDVVDKLNNGIQLQDMDDIVRFRYEVSRDPNNTMAREATMAEARDNIDKIHLLDPEEIMRIKTETLVVHGREDTIMPPTTGLKFHELLTNSWLVSFPNSGHWAMLQYPEAYVELCSWFLRSKTLTKSRTK